MITSSKHARNRTKQEFWGLDRLQQTEAHYKTDGEERDSFRETPTVFHHHSSTDLSGVSYQSQNFLFLCFFSSSSSSTQHMSTAAAPAARCSFCSLDLDTLCRPGRTQPDFWDGGNQHFSETAEGRKSAATANVKINKWFGNQPFFWCLVQPRHPIISNTIVDLSYTSFKEAASKIFICSIAIETSCAALTHSSFRLKRDRQRKKTCPRLKNTCGSAQNLFLS